ncbi:VWA domain-containing protein [uncultured Jannaschia sp.]|uniref:vWA domain-containing protein n=1 Tax=uncultured Jannaschia sp. TaxID=293347 RepID=UPI00261422D6|nr:vWA domain-containing protein [uncultured Jannaschia sp.]
MARRGLAALLSAALAVQSAQAECTVDAMLVFDASASMISPGLGGSTVQRIHEAREAVAEVLPRVEHTRRIGLVTYGPGGPGACSGIDLRFGPRVAAADPVIAAVDAIQPGGLTPLSAAVDLAARTLDHRAQPGVVVLVTDGNESCGGTPCAMADRLASEAVNLTIHVIGFKAVWDTFARSYGTERSGGFSGEIISRCMADRTGGIFASADTVEELVAALERTLGCLVVGRASAPGSHLPG